jgi:aspartyl-tRNA(Asn)/glutamyl-tRNA(Gln) amidotransferase subunit C
MSISHEEILKIAQLAHLRFQSDELGRFSQEFVRILEYFESLENLDLAGIEPTSHMAGSAPAIGAGYRPDQVRSGLSVDEALREAPEKGNGHFLVPRFIG